MKMFAKTVRSAFALVLVAALFLGVCGSPIALALESIPDDILSGLDKDGNGTINYVSLGDSMTNGYGMEEGYMHNSGVEDYGKEAYPNQFADWLTGKGFTVDHAQLAMSGIRTEDIHWLLELDYNNQEVIEVINEFVAENNKADEVWDQAKWNEYFSCGDYWTINEICNHSRTNATFYHIAGGVYNDNDDCKNHAPLMTDMPDTYVDGSTMGERVAVIAKYYQEHVAAADVISLSVGNGNIGVFGFGRILESIGFYETTTYLNYNYEDLLRECDPETKTCVMEMVEQIKPALAAYSPSSELTNVALYIAVSLVLNYAGTLDAILQSNPDVEIILVPVMNTFASETKEVEGITIGDLMETVVDPINKYIAGLPAAMKAAQNEVYAEATFYWAEPGYVSCMVDEYTYPLSEGTVRDRFVESIVGDDGDGMVWYMAAPLFNNLLSTALVDTEIDLHLVNIDVADIVAYEDCDLEDADKILSCAIYLAFEEAVVSAKDTAVGVNSIMGLGSTDGLFDGIGTAISGGLNVNAIMADVMNSVTAAGNDDVTTWASNASNTATISQVTTFCETSNINDSTVIAKVAYAVGNELVTIDGLSFSDNPVKDVTAAMTAHFTEKYATYYAASTLGGSIRPLLAEALVTDTATSGLLALFARCVIGNGLGAHPSAEGHNELARAVIEAYENDFTVTDKTIENLIEIFPDAAKFVNETEALVKELKAIILENEAVVEELNANLVVMNAEVEALAASLEEKLAELDKLENEYLASLKADRAELEAVLAGLEEKLEAVVNGTYGRSAASDKEALIEDTKAAIEETKADIAELDATIAYVVNQIKTDKSGIEAIKTDIAEIKANIAATENALADVVETIDQLDADIAVLADAVAVLYEVAAGQFVDEAAVVEAIVAIAQAVPSMVENVKALYEQGVVAAEAVEALVNVVNENAESINDAVEALNTSAEAWVNINAEKAEAIADTLNEVKALLDTFVNENYPAVETAVSETVNKLNLALKDYVDNDVMALVEAYEEEALIVVGIAYLYCEEKRYIEYVKNTVEGYITDAETMVEDLKAELKDAKIELEAKRAELEAKIPGWKEDLRQLKEDLLEEADAKKAAAIEAAIAELEDEIAAAEALVEELEAFVEAVEAHIEEVEAAIDAVKAALEVVDGDVEALNAALMNLVDALADLGCSVADLGATVIGEAEKLVGYGVMIGEDVVAVLETLCVYGDLAERLADVIVSELIENKLEVLEYLAGVAADVCEHLVKAIADAIVEYLPELDEALYNYFYNNPEEVIDFVKTYGHYLLPIVEEYGDEALAAIGYVLYMYGEDMAVYVIENHEAILAGFVNWVDKYGERTAAMLQVYAETLGLCDAVRDQIAELEAELEKLEAELEKATGEAKEAIEAKITEVKAAIAELEAKLAAVIEALNKAAEDVNAKVEDLIADIEDAIDDLEAALEDLEKAVEDLINETLKAIRDEIFEGNRIVLEKILGITEDILNKNIETLEELVATLDEAAVEAAKEIKAIIGELVYDATHGEYVIENDSFYVALGDSSAVSKSYVDALAAYLDVDYANLANVGELTSDTLETIKANADLLAKADLVTVGYTANIFTAEVTYTLQNVLMGKPVEEYDWVALVGEDGAVYVEKALAEVRAKLVEEGLDVEVSGRNIADTLMVAVEAYAYRYVEHVLTYPEIVNEIHAVAPEALVVIVGLHNTVENIVIDMEGTEIALGEYVQYAVDAANVISLVNAILVDNTVFVDAPDVETLKEEKGDELTYDMISFVMEAIITNGADFATSENGHAYIAEQIINALTIIDNRTGLLGDADGDGDVDSTDAMLVLQYDALLIDKDQLNLLVCDVDGDGDVDSTDAMLILQYDALLIEVFPVEE